MQAYCRKAEDYRLFKINRILEITVQEERFVIPPDDPPPIEVDYPISYPYTQMLLRFSPSIAFRIYDEFDRSSIEQQPDGSLLVHACFPQDAAVGYLHLFGADVTILEPEEMRRIVADYAKAIWEHHSAMKK